MSCFQVSGEIFSEKSNLQEDLGIPLVPRLGRKTKTKKNCSASAEVEDRNIDPVILEAHFTHFTFALFFGEKMSRTSGD